MRFAVKLLISLAVIVVCIQLARRWPTLAGLVAVMPLAGLIVLVWLYLDNPGNFALMNSYCKGALYGIIPTVLFYLTALVCFQKRLSLLAVLCLSFTTWLLAAIAHQLLLHQSR